MRIITPTTITRHGTPGLICGGKSCFFRTALYFAIRYLIVSRRRSTSSLLFATTLLALCVTGCGTGDAAKPDLPASISPGWKLQNMAASAPPASLPQLGAAPVCWKASYTGNGDVTVQVCGYHVSAFEAAQRMPSAANEVKFYKGVYLVIVHWDNVSQASITALVGALQRSLHE